MGKLIDALIAGYVGSVNEKGYFDSYRENIYKGEMKGDFQKMFDEGSGGELHSKAEAVHSSSMLSYNFFHWIDAKHPFEWGGVKYTQVFFEVKMKTIIGSPAPANMDVVLIDKNNSHVLFIESKFTEYTETKKFELSESYKDENKWLNPNVAWGKIVDYKPNNNYKYKEGIKQLITHLFGIHGQVVEPCKTFENIDFESVQMKFITLIFKPSEKDFADEHEAYNNYHELFKDFKSNIENAGLKVVPGWVSYSDLWKDMKEQMPEDLKNYLWERYMKFAQI